MNHTKIVFSFIFLLGTLILTFSQTSAEPVLIQLTLEESGDWSKAISLGVVAYQRFDNFVLAEFESEKLPELDKVDLKYQIIDGEPWSEEYFLISPVEGVAKVNLELYGKILLKDPKWQLIKTSREKAFELMPLGYKVTPINHKPIPLKYKPPLTVTKSALTYSGGIDSLVNLVSEDSLRTWVQRLQNFHTRYSYSDSVIKARDWLYDKMVSFGIDSVWFHHYYWDSHQYNVVATVVGTAKPDKVIVVGGHYDSVVYGSGTNPYTWAPGADDNATGTVAALEMARIIAQNPLPVTVMFVPFAQEEQGLIGSDHFAEYLHNNNADVELMINSDMIAHSVDPDPDVMIYAAANAMNFVSIMIAMANTYTYLRPVYGGQSYGSDQYSFNQWGYHAVAAGEGDFHTAGWHTNYDIIDSLNLPYYKEVVKMCLATLLLVGKSPSTVENLKALDAGDGHTIYLSWSANPPADNVVYYKVHFGTASGDYDSVYQVSATCDTLHDLEADITYFIAVTAVNADGFEGATTNEVSIAPRTVPLPPRGLVANPAGLLKIKLSWFPNQEADFDYYNIYRSENSGTGYQLLSDAYKDTAFVDSTVQSNVPYYYYTLTAVDTSGNESERSAEAKAFVISLNQGILLVDMTLGEISNGVNSDSVNAFYQRALEGYDYTYADHSNDNDSPLTLLELGTHPIVIVHSEDEMAYYSLNNYLTYSVLKEYLDVGGALLIEGRKNLSGGLAVSGPQFMHFAPGDFRHDYLNIDSAYIPFWNFSPSLPYRTEEFIGANRTPQMDGYPETVELDTFRVNHAFDPWSVNLDGKLPGVGYFMPLDSSEVIYTFISAYDTSASDGKPVALKHFSDGFAVIYFDFPLYFVREDIATQILHKALSDLQTFADVEERDEESKAPASFSLRQNYPNPFNSETIIEYSLPKESQVKIAIYNILGQRVKTLVDQRQAGGYKKVIWDGKNEKGNVVSSGIYFYRMETEKFVQSKKMLILK